MMMKTAVVVNPTNAPSGPMARRRAHTTDQIMVARTATHEGWCVTVATPTATAPETAVNEPQPNLRGRAEGLITRAVLRPPIAQKRPSE